jgi:hypothetical protein
VGEGVSRTSNPADRVAAKRPHPGPLPRGEGATSENETRLNVGCVHPPRLRAASRFRGDLLHSTCIFRVPPLSPALAQGASVV